MLERDWLDKGNRSRLCVLLGLKLGFLDRLEEMPPQFRERYTLGDWICTLLRGNCESVSSESKASLNRDLLDEIGFDPQSKAVENILTRALSGSSEHHIEACEWAEIFIKDELKYNPLLNPVSFAFPFNRNVTNSWFQIANINGERESKEGSCHVNAMNLVTKESFAYSDIHALFSQDEQNTLLFHGTDHFSAADILDRGIDLCAGRQRRDFSCGSGFYLTKHLDVAIDWAKSTSTKPAILAYQVDSEILDNARTLNLFVENEGRWREIVSSFRLGQRTAKTRKNLINSYNLIEGPVATLTSSETGELEFKPQHSCYQMCLISDDFAEVFQQTLHSIVFYDIAS